MGYNEPHPSTIGNIMSNKTAPVRFSTVEFLALGAAFTHHCVKTSVKKNTKKIANKLSRKA